MFEKLKCKLSGKHSQNKFKADSKDLSDKAEDNILATIIGVVVFFALLTFFAYSAPDMENAGVLSKYLFLLKGVGTTLCSYGTGLFVHSFTGGTKSDRTKGISLLLSGFAIILLNEPFVRCASCPII